MHTSGSSCLEEDEWKGGKALAQVSSVVHHWHQREECCICQSQQTTKQIVQLFQASCTESLAEYTYTVSFHLGSSRQQVVFSIDDDWITCTIMHTFFPSKKWVCLVYALHWTFQVNAFSSRITSHCKHSIRLSILLTTCRTVNAALQFLAAVWLSVWVEGCRYPSTCVIYQLLHHQRKLQVMPTASASEVFALFDGRKTPPAQVAEGQDHLGH